MLAHIMNFPRKRMKIEDRNRLIGAKCRLVCALVKAVIDKARVLVEALPYISQFRGRTVVVKIGGAALDDAQLRERFAEDITLLHWVGVNVVIIHGGGRQISAMLDRVGITPTFVDGMRVTDQQILEIVEMVLGGQLNQEIVRVVNRLGGKAVGLTGKDGRLVIARQASHAELGLVGEVERVHRSVIDRLTPDFIPVVAPLAVSETGETLNINADEFAARIAVALAAEKLVLMTDVTGVEGADGTLVTTITASETQKMIADGVIHGGMIPKVRNAVRALQDGVHKVHIIDGRLEHALLLEIFTQEGVGTQLVCRGEEGLVPKG